MARAFKAPTMTALHLGLCEKIANMPKEQLDVVTSVDVQIHNVVAEAESMEWDFDLKDLWLTKGRWSMMVRQYLDPTDLVAWLEKTAGMVGWDGRGISMLRTNVVKPRGGRHLGNKESRRWGSCMLAVSYKAQPAPQITLYSRTSYLGYLSGLDLSVAWMCGRYLMEMIDRKIEDVRFLWMNEACQYHHFKSLAYFLNHKDPDKQAFYRHILMSHDGALTDEEKAQIAAAPALYHSRKWLRKAIDEDERGLTLGDISYNTYRRIKRRFHTEVLGYDVAQQYEGWSHYKTGEHAGEPKEYFKAYQPLPHVRVEDLDFTAVGLPSIDRLHRVDYDDTVVEVEVEGE